MYNLMFTFDPSENALLQNDLGISKFFKYNFKVEQFLELRIYYTQEASPLLRPFEPYLYSFVWTLDFNVKDTSIRLCSGAQCFRIIRLWPFLSNFNESLVFSAIHWRRIQVDSVQYLLLMVKSTAVQKSALMPDVRDTQDFLGAALFSTVHITRLLCLDALEAGS